MTATSTASPATVEPVRPRGATANEAIGSGRFDRVDALIVILLGAAVFAVHDVGYMLRHPFWVDEAWVADSLRAPIGEAGRLTSSTPLGWTVLLRVVPGAGAQRLRLLPLAFTALATITAYLLGRELRLGRYRAGILTGIAILLCPAMLLRDDLKQYTTEGWAALVIMALVVRIENTWSTKRLMVLGGFVVGALLISNTVVFVGLAALLAVGLECLMQRDYGRLRSVAAVLLATLAASAAYFELVLRPHMTSQLRAFWTANYLPRKAGIQGAGHFIWSGTVHLGSYVAGPWFALDAVLVIAGTAALAARRRLAAAAMLPLVYAMVLVASYLHLYPFGDLRTSTFWLVLCSVLAAIGLADGVDRMAHRSRPAAWVVVVALIAACWTGASGSYVRAHPLPNEDVRSQVDYLNRHLRSGDVVILSYKASFAFAYYDSRLTPTFRPFPAVENGFLPEFPAAPWLVQMTNRTPFDVAAALSAARQSAGDPRGTGRIWIVRSHLRTAEQAAWAKDLTGAHVAAVTAGPEPLLLLTTARTGPEPALSSTG